MTRLWQRDMDLSEERYDEVKELLGNLTLLNRAQNSRIQQKPWVDANSENDSKKSKRAAYENSEFNVTSDLAKIETWSDEVIQSRGAWIKAMFVATRNPDSGTHSAAIPFSEWYLTNTGARKK